MHPADMDGDDGMTIPPAETGGGKEPGEKQDSRILPAGCLENF